MMEQNYNGNRIWNRLKEWNDSLNHGIVAEMQAGLGW